jgi:hypothetical protein
VICHAARPKSLFNVSIGFGTGRVFGVPAFSSTRHTQAVGTHIRALKKATKLPASHRVLGHCRTTGQVIQSILVIRRARLMDLCLDGPVDIPVGSSLAKPIEEAIAPQNFLDRRLDPGEP